LWEVNHTYLNMSAPDSVLSYTKTGQKKKVNTFSAHVALHLQYNDGTKLRQMYKMDEGKSLYWFTLDLFILNQFLIQHSRQSLMSLVDFIIKYLFTMHHKEHS